MAIQNIDILRFLQIFSILEIHDLEEAVLVESKFGTTLLLDKLGFLYKVNHKSKTSGKVWWKCHKYDKFKCSARAITDGPSILSRHGNHNHFVPVQDYNE